MRVFLALARTGTLTAAAQDLGCGVATVSRQIERLEAALGFSLFTRHQSGYRLTDDGAAILERAETVELGVEAFVDGSAAQGDVAGRVRLATAETLATHLFIPRLAPLLDVYPGLEVEVLSDVGVVNLHRRDADMAVRMVEPERGNLVVRRIGRIGFGLYASASYVAAMRGVAPDLSSGRHRAVCWSDRFAMLPAARWMERTLPRARPALITQSLSTQLAGVCAGVGLGVLPHFLARRLDLTCLATNAALDQDIWLALHADLAQSRRVRAVADFVVGEIQTAQLVS